MGSQAHGFGRIPRSYTFHLEQNLSRLYHCHPVIGSAFTLAHTGLGGFLGYRLVGKQANPDFSSAFDEARHGNPTGFNLPVSNPTRLEHLQSIVSESQLA